MAEWVESAEWVAVTVPVEVLVYVENRRGHDAHAWAMTQAREAVLAVLNRDSWNGDMDRDGEDRSPYELPGADEWAPDVTVRLAP